MSKRSTNKPILYAVAFIILVGVIVLIVYLLSSKTSVSNLATPALDNQASMTSEKNDVNIVDAAVASYIGSHNEVLPQTTATGASSNVIDICGVSCTGGNQVTATLGYFKNTPSAVQFHAYKANLTVPNDTTLYIVEDAECNSSKTGVVDKTQNITVVFLYAYSLSSGLQQQCLGL